MQRALSIRAVIIIRFRRNVAEGWRVCVDHCTLRAVCIWTRGCCIKHSFAISFIVMICRIHDGIIVFTQTVRSGDADYFSFLLISESVFISVSVFLTY